ncbi:STM4014 family protein [Actinocorallia libanotica]|uniref:ATP-grasp domain-containing protein n=1 Tax=Actinocorallia libanotica TaxID=46162 RepID=A0ABP4CDY3_9ACTN
MTGFTIVGTPGDRRVEAFAAACASSGVSRPRLLPWTDVLSGAPLEVDGLLRIDSPGEAAEADALLRGPGDPARVGGGARWYRTLLGGLERLRGFPSTGDVDEIAVMFDKRACHARLSEAGVPVPVSLGPVGGYRGLRERMAERRVHHVFVKPAHGSSASGVVALRTAPGRIKAVSSAVPHGDGWRNSLRVRAYTSEPEVARLVDALAPDGLHVEQWFPKAALDGRLLDLRVVVVAGEPTHAVVRTSTAPMTNLHLGGARGDLEAVRARVDWPEAMSVCARAAACFPRSLIVAVDLMIGLGWRRLAVAEVNAFGDLLPGLTGLPGTSAEGLDTYTAQVRAALRTSSPKPPDAFPGTSHHDHRNTVPATGKTPCP